MSMRPVQKTSTSRPTIEGAGVHLHRAFGFGGTEEFDPFLLLDDFRNDRPDDYRAGFPWHPHRGIETVTYVLAGTVAHGDSLGNRGAIGAGGVQWMTAGSGIIHQEMPEGDDQGRMHGFQLWLNLPREHKMTPPRYQDIRGEDVPVVGEDDGTVVRVICGSLWGATGPVDGIAGEPTYVDVAVPPGATRRIPSPTRPNRWQRRRSRETDRGSSRPMSATDRSCCSTPVTKWWCAPGRGGSASCSSRVGRSASRSRGTVQSS